MKNFIPYGRQYIDDQDKKAVFDVLSSDYLTTGPKILEFESELEKVTNSKYVIAVSNGTAALHLLALAFLNRGDKVITTPNSFLATSNALLYVGAEPVFLDTDKNGLLNLDLVEAYLKKNSDIKAVFGVHFSGLPLDQEKLKGIKEKFNILIIEDCAHSIGAYDIFNGVKIASGSSTYSDASILSFHPVKHITSGEGGAITTNDYTLYKKLLVLRSHGMVKENFINLDMAVDEQKNDNIWYYEMQNLGFNYRMTDIQAALGISQLKKLDKFVKRRHEIAKKYDIAFKNHNYIKSLYEFTKKSSYHLYVLLIDFDSIGISRNKFMNRLRDKMIGTQVHYIPINKQPYYQNMGYGNESTPNNDNFYKKALSIPMYPLLTDEEQEYVIENILELTNG